MSYPTAANLVSYLAEMGVTVPSGTAGGRIAAVVSEFERQTGWVPFVGVATPEARIYDAPFGIAGVFSLHLEGGIYDITGLTVEFLDYQGNWTVQPAADYVLRSWVPVAGSPVVIIGLKRLPVPRYQSVRVTGRWGYHANCPADVFQAMLDKAASDILATTALAQSPAQEVKLQDMTVKSGAGYEAMTARAATDWQRVIERYRRF
jgi:hypothetical protein